MITKKTFIKKKKNKIYSNKPANKTRKNFAAPCSRKNKFGLKFVSSSDRILIMYKHF